MSEEQAAPKFDWVQKRSACSYPNVFKALSLDVEEDVKARNALRPANAPYEFSVAVNGNHFTVLLEGKLGGNGVRKAVKFSLAEHGISVLDDQGKEFQVTLSFTEAGECKLRVGEQEREMWQVRRMALEDILFRDY